MQIPRYVALSNSNLRIRVEREEKRELEGGGNVHIGQSALGGC